MYNFRDVNEASEGVVLPSEAMKINGQYIEDLIAGYRTLNVSGREALSPDVEEFDVGIRDGSVFKSKRYPSRVIVVTYQLIAESNEAFREAYNQLGKILDVKDAELIFNDEQDKFFTGTPCIIDAVNPGTNAVVGKFEILCTDPFKYSVVEYEATAAQDEKCIYVDYNGTYKAHPKLEAEFFNEAEVKDDGETAVDITGAGDCGYVAFFNEDEKIIQLGDPDEVDGEHAFAKSQGLINQTFITETAWGTTAKNLWTVNDGHIMATNVQQMGSVYMGEATPPKTATVSVSSAIGGAAASGTVPVYYSVSATTSKRKTDSVSVSITIKATPQKDVDRRSSGISVVVRIGASSNSMAIRSVGTAWKKGTTYSKTITLSVGGLTASQTTISGVVVTISGSGVFGSTTIVCSPIKLGGYSITTAEATHYLTPNAYGTYTGAWHGPSIRRAVGADASGEVGAANFSLSYRQQMCIGKESNAANQVGSFRANVTDANGKNIVGIWVYKNKQGKAGKLVFFVNGKQENITDIDLHFGNDFFGGAEEAVCTTTITKQGSTISFAVGSYTRSFTNAALANVVARYVTFSFEKYSDLTPLKYNGLYWAKFIKHNCTTYKDIPNKFTANDIVVADCKNAEIKLNGIKSANLGALGNDWEGFVLKPGLNQIGFSYSDWVTDEYAPTFKCKYREVFL